jgi:hypothetical protein
MPSTMLLLKNGLEQEKTLFCSFVNIIILSFHFICIYWVTRLQPPGTDLPNSDPSFKKDTYNKTFGVFQPLQMCKKLNLCFRTMLVTVWLV